MSLHTDGLRVLSEYSAHLEIDSGAVGLTQAQRTAALRLMQHVASDHGSCYLLCPTGALFRDRNTESGCKQWRHFKTACNNNKTPVYKYTRQSGAKEADCPGAR